MMKAWCDLSWREKCKIEEGDVSILKYQTGYTFDVKAKAREGIEKKKGTASGLCAKQRTVEVQARGLDKGL